jgi:hypothetical protein
MQGGEAEREVPWLAAGKFASGSVSQLPIEKMMTTVDTFQKEMPLLQRDINVMQEESQTVSNSNTIPRCSHLKYIDK